MPESHVERPCICSGDRINPPRQFAEHAPNCPFYTNYPSSGYEQVGDINFPSESIRGSAEQGET